MDNLHIIQALRYLVLCQDLIKSICSQADNNEVVFEIVEGYMLHHFFHKFAVLGDGSIPYSSSCYIELLIADFK